MRSTFAFEGNEGSGKSVLSKLFAKKIDAFWTFEPNGETELLKNLRSLALTQNPEMTHRARELIMMANRSIHNREIIAPKIRDGAHIVSDRSFFSGMVYAKIEGMDFPEWFDLYQMAQIKFMPNILIYVRNKNRKIEKEEDNIYDHASEALFKRIDLLYEEGLWYLARRFPKIKVIEHENNFQLTPEENLNELIKKLQEQNVMEKILYSCSKLP